MKNNIIKITTYIAIGLVAGLLGGYALFNQTPTPAANSHTDTTTHAHNEESVDQTIYTCSMHPQIQQNEPGDCPLCGMDLIPLEANNSNDPLVLEMTSEAVKLANIQTTIVGKSTGQSSGKTMQLSGKVQPDERLASSQVAHVSGRIEKLFVSFTGEQVNKGQKIATLYSPELITAQSELLEALKLETLNPGLVEAARNKLRYLKIGKATIERIEGSGTIQETFTVYADESGIVTNKRVSVGDYVKRGEPLFELMNLSKVWVLFDAYEEDLTSIKKGDNIEFTTPSLGNTRFKTKVTFIDPIINPNTRVASIRTEVKNSKGLLKPEMLVYGSLQKKSTKTSKLTVPKSAVLWTGKRSVVYVKVPDMTVPSFQFREVEIGDAQGDSYQILEGLETGEEVVTYGSFTIDAAAQLNNQASMMNRNVKLKKEEPVGVPNFQAETPVEFKKQLSIFTNEYIQLKNAFINTDPTSAITAAKKVEKSLGEIDMALLKGDAHIYWMEQLNAIQGHSKKISDLTDIEEQRKQFGFLSTALINSIEAFGTTGEALYVQYCPMAFNNDGADWLSLKTEIENPYFGDKMMKCGSVKKEFAVQ